MALIMFNIGWMKRYQGQTATDRISNGGSWVAENEIGGEVENFLPLGNRYYGYARVHGGGNLDMTRLGADADADFVDDATVVFVATRPQGGRVVVGWYRHARVWRTTRPRTGRENRYIAEADTNNCRLLEEDERLFRVPTARGGKWGMSRDNVRYTDERRAKTFVRKLQKYLEDPLAPRGGAPRQPDPERRKMVEEAAIQHVIDHYRAYNWVSVEGENKGWDLEFTCESVKLLVEVKGCSGDCGYVELTPNEFKAMRRFRHRFRLAIVTKALVDPQLSIVSFNRSDETWRDQSDREVHLEERVGARVPVRG